GNSFGERNFAEVSGGVVTEELAAGEAGEIAEKIFAVGGVFAFAAVVGGDEKGVVGELFAFGHAAAVLDAVFAGFVGAEIGFEAAGFPERREEVDLAGFAGWSFDGGGDVGLAGGAEIGAHDVDPGVEIGGE